MIRREEGNSARVVGVTGVSEGSTAISASNCIFNKGRRIDDEDVAIWNHNMRDGLGGKREVATEFPGKRTCPTWRPLPSSKKRAER